METPRFVSLSFAFLFLVFFCDEMAISDTSIHLTSATRPGRSRCAAIQGLSNELKA